MYFAKAQAILPLVATTFLNLGQDGRSCRSRGWPGIIPSIPYTTRFLTGRSCVPLRSQQKGFERARNSTVSAVFSSITMHLLQSFYQQNNLLKSIFFGDDSLKLLLDDFLCWKSSNYWKMLQVNFCTTLHRESYEL